MTDDYSYHRPVLLEASIEGLITRTDGTYVDATFGGGGHSREILKKLSGGKLIAFDQDIEAKAESEKIEDRSFTFCKANFRHLKRYLRTLGIEKVDGILADLGISSHQIDTPNRGFSTRFDGELDMRMDPNSDRNAADLVNELSEGELVKVLGMYGEVRNARTLAAAIVRKRVTTPIRTIEDLKEILKPLARRGKENRYFAQVFQAFRIALNDEMGALEDLLEQSTELISPGGRLVVIAYHSLEDRMVKNFIRSGNIQGRETRDLYGNRIRPFETVNKKPLTAGEEELKINNRARSARLRIAIKNNGGE